MENAKKILGKGEMILGIVEIFDIAEEAIRENNELKRQQHDASSLLKSVPQPEGAGISGAEAIMLKIGRKKVYEDCICDWRKVSASKDDETGEIKVQKFDKWLNDKIYSVPDYMSRDEFCAYFDHKLREDYEREKADAIARLAVEGDE